MRRNLKGSILRLRDIRKNADNLRTQHLAERATAFNIINNSSSKKNNNQHIKVEQIIKMWRIIKFLLFLKQKVSIKTVDVTVDNTIDCNTMKKNKELKFKIIDDDERIDKLIAERNAHHSNQTEGIPLIVKLLVSLIGIYSFISFTANFLEGTVDLTFLNLSLIVKNICKD